jgi:hypothetical protein
MRPKFVVCSYKEYNDVLEFIVLTSYFVSLPRCGIFYYMYT